MKLNTFDEMVDNNLAYMIHGTKWLDVI
jgi:hypothetical protein